MGKLTSVACRTKTTNWHTVTPSQTAKEQRLNAKLPHKNKGEGGGGGIPDPLPPLDENDNIFRLVRGSRRCKKFLSKLAAAAMFPNGEPKFKKKIGWRRPSTEES